MRQEVADRWVEALESGKYVQTTGALHVGTCFCAVGVLCDLYLKDVGEDWIAAPVREDLEAPPFLRAAGYSLPEGRWSAPTQKVYKWMTTGTQYGEIIDAEMLVSRIAEMNDDQHRSFREIAHYIKSHVSHSPRV